MKNIKIKTFIPAILSAFLITGCSGFFDLNPDRKSDKVGNSISIVVNNSSATRTISPYTLTEEKLSLVSEWNVKLIDIEHEEVDPVECSVIPSSGVLTMSLPFTGFCRIEISGTIEEDGRTFKICGTKDEAEIFAGAVINIGVDFEKSGFGTFEYELKLDSFTKEDYCEFFGESCHFRDLQPDMGVPVYGEVELDDTISVSAKLTTYEMEDIPLEAKVYVGTWSTSLGYSGNGISRIEIKSDDQIPAGTYALTVTSSWLEDGEEKQKEFLLTDCMVEIFGDRKTTGSGVSYFSRGGVYYVTNKASTYNGLSPKARANFKTLLESWGSTKGKLIVYFDEDEDDISDFKNWDVWNDWEQEFEIIGYIEDSEERLFEGTDFYRGYYRTIFASFDADKVGSGNNDGLSPESPVDGNSASRIAGLIGGDPKRSAHYSVCYSDISGYNDYQKVYDLFDELEIGIDSIILEHKDSYTQCQWSRGDAGEHYFKHLVLGNGITSCSIKDDSIETVTLGDGFESLEAYYLSECTSLKTIVFGSNLKYVSENAIFNCDNLQTIVVPESADTWYASNGKTIGSADFANAKDLLSSSEKPFPWELISAPVDFGTPYVLWSGKNNDPDSFKNFSVYDKISKYPSAIRDLDDYIIDFAFDKNGNLYTTMKSTPAQSSNQLMKYAYNGAAGYGDGEEIKVGTSPIGSTRTTLYYDYDQDVVYAKDSTSIKACKGNAAPVSYEANITGDIYAVHNGYVYSFETSGTKGEIALAGQLSGAELAKIDGISVVLYGEGAVTGLPGDNGMTVTDMQIVEQGGDAYMYVLVRQCSSRFYSRGAVVRLIINEDGSLTFKDKCGWYDENEALNVTWRENEESVLYKDPEGRTEAETIEYFMKNYFTGPVRFVAIKPDELVIADDGAYWINSDRFKNVNRIVTVDLESFAINDSYDVGSTFDETAQFGDGGSQFGEIEFKPASE